MIQKTALEVSKGTRSYQFVLEIGSPLGEIYDVLHEMKEMVLLKIKDLHEQKKSELPVSELPVETEVSCVADECK